MHQSTVDVWALGIQCLVESPGTSSRSRRHEPSYAEAHCRGIDHIEEALPPT